jgi:Glyoxalase/Bleomycin resistance protein/Dioxygenase superfamily
LIKGVHLFGIVVEDLDQAVADFNEVFEVDLQIYTQEELGLRFAPTEAGICLIAPIAPGSSRMVDVWHNGGLGGVEILVDDLEATRAKLEAKGVKPVYRGSTPGGFDEYVMQRFHGIPLVICTRKVESLLGTMGGPDGDVAGGANTPFEWMNDFV